MFGPRLPLMLKCSLCLEKENENSKCGSDISPGSTVPFIILLPQSVVQHLELSRSSNIISTKTSHLG